MDSFDIIFGVVIIIVVVAIIFFVIRDMRDLAKGSKESKRKYEIMKKNGESSNGKK